MRSVSHHDLTLQWARDRFLWLPAALAVGIGTYFSLSHEPHPAHIVGILIASIIMLIFYHGVRKRYAHPAPFLCGIACVGLGFCLAFFHTHIRSTPMIDDFYKDVDVKGHISRIEDRPTGQRITLEHVHIYKNESQRILQRVQSLRLNDTKAHPYHIGDFLHVTATLVPFSGPLTPNGMHMRRQAYFDGLSAQGRIKNLKSITPYSPADQSYRERIRHILTSWRHTMSQMLYERMSPSTRAIAMALVTGEKAYISDSARQAFVDAGIAHILAISGLHLSIIAAFLFMLIRRSLALSMTIAERYPIKTIAAISVIGVTFMYMLIAGAGYPVQRAFLMTSLAMLALCVNRSPFSLRLLAIAALVILSAAPHSLLTASFQLSFAAVVALVSFHESCLTRMLAWGRQGGRIRKTVTYIGGMLGTTCVATLATTPFTIFFFNRFTVQALLGNMLAIPLVSIVVMPLAFVCTLCLSLPPIPLVYRLWDASLNLLQNIAYFVASCPGSAIRVPTPPLWVIIIIVVGGLWLMLMRSPPYVWRNVSMPGLRLWGLIPITIGTYSLTQDFTPDVILTKKTIVYKDQDSVYAAPGSASFEVKILTQYFGAYTSKTWSDTQTSTQGVQMIQVPHYPYRVPYIPIQKGTFLIVTNGWMSQRAKNAFSHKNIHTYDRNALTSGAVLGFFKGHSTPLVCHDTAQRPWT